MKRSIAVVPTVCATPAGGGPRTSSSARDELGSAFTSAKEEAHEVVEDEDARRARDDGGVDRAADPRRAALRRQPEVAARERDDQAEDEALEEAVGDVAEAEEAAGDAVVEGRRIDVEERLAGVGGAEERERVGEER